MRNNCTYIHITHMEWPVCNLPRLTPPSSNIPHSTQHTTHLHRIYIKIIIIIYGKCSTTEWKRAPNNELVRRVSGSLHVVVVAIIFGVLNIPPHLMHIISHFEWSTKYFHSLFLAYSLLWPILFGPLFSSYSFDITHIEVCNTRVHLIESTTTITEIK